MFRSIVKHFGEGIPPLAPPLTNSNWVLGPEGRLIRIVLHGMEGPVHVNGTICIEMTTMKRFPMCVHRVVGTLSAFGWVLGAMAQGTIPGPVAGLTLVAGGFAAPIDLAAMGDGSGRLLVADQAGFVYVLDRTGERHETPFLDLRSRMVPLHPGMDERGVTGLAQDDEGELYVLTNGANMVSGTRGKVFKIVPL